MFIIKLLLIQYCVITSLYVWAMCIGICYLVSAYHPNPWYNIRYIYAYDIHGDNIFVFHTMRTSIWNEYEWLSLPLLNRPQHFPHAQTGIITTIISGNGLIVTAWSDSIKTFKKRHCFSLFSVAHNEHKHEHKLAKNATTTTMKRGLSK